MRVAGIAAWALVAVSATAMACAVAASVAAGTLDDERWVALASIVATAACAAVGLLLAVRRPRNPIGWLLLSEAVVLSAAALAAAWADHAVRDQGGSLAGASWAVLWDQRAWPLLFLPVGAILWIYPDGRLPGPRWRPAAIAAVVAASATVALSLLAWDRVPAELRGLGSPLPTLAEDVVAVPLSVALLGTFAALLAGPVALIVRYRRADGRERLQITWLAFGSSLVPLAVVVCIAESRLLGGADAFTAVALAVAVAAIPVSVGVAVMGHHLYGIDRIVNRTIVYVVLTAGLGAVFAAVSLGLGLALGSGSVVPTAVATLAAAVLFFPLRNRAQLAVDKRFDRARYDALRRVHRFLEDLREGREMPEHTGAMLAAALEDPSLELRFPASDGGPDLDAWGRALAPPDPGRVLTPVRRGAFPVASVAHDSALVRRPHLLDGVIGEAALAIEIARLGVEVHRQLAEVEASRARIVTAGIEERRRLERDIHDGTQQRLVSIGLALRNAQGGLRAGDPVARTLDDTVAEVSRAIEELRELARGVRPAALDDGLGYALRDLASRAPLATRVRATEDRFPDVIETAAYFVASEALANATKHAGARQVEVSATRRDGHLVVTVHDDGVGGATPTDGTGLAGIADRVAALGGRLSVASPPGQGTLITAELPCA